MVICIAKVLKRNERHTGRIPRSCFLELFSKYVLALYDQASMAIRALFASHAALSNSSYALRLENNSPLQVWIGGEEPTLTE